MERKKIVDLRTGQIVPDITLNGAFQVPIFKLQDMHTAFDPGPAVESIAEYKTYNTVGEFLKDFQTIEYELLEEDITEIIRVGKNKEWQISNYLKGKLLDIYRRNRTIRGSLVDAEIERQKDIVKIKTAELEIKIQDMRQMEEDIQNTITEYQKKNWIKKILSIGKFIIELKQYLNMYEV